MSAGEGVSTSIENMTKPSQHSERQVKGGRMHMPEGIEMQLPLSENKWERLRRELTFLLQSGTQYVPVLMILGYMNFLEDEFRSKGGSHD